MSLYKEAWNKLYKKLEHCTLVEPNQKDEVDVCYLMDMCLEEARKKARETQKELNKKLKEFYKERKYFE